MVKGMDMQDMATNLLREHGLRVTDIRVDALAVFLRHEYALSQPDLERSLPPGYDRVTVYRTLTSFLEKGLVHRVLDDAGASKYALCQHTAHRHVHHDEHIHFKCTRCGNTHCLQGMTAPSFRAPSGYTFSDTSVLIQGVCRGCNEEA